MRWIAGVVLVCAVWGVGGQDEQTAEYWRAEAAAGVLAAREARGAGGTGDEHGARNVIMFLGDGMSVETQTAARILRAQREGRRGEESRLHFETFPTVGLAKTYCVDRQVPDSGCTATAYLTGVKTNQGVIGLTAAVPRYNCSASLDPSTHLTSLADWALADGRDAGLVTTTRVSHASPAGVFARAANRHWEVAADVRADGGDPALCPDITHQLVHHHPGHALKVILGGGRREFLPDTATDEEGAPGRRQDGRDLIAEWTQDKQARGVTHQYVWNRTALMALSQDPPDYLLGLFESSHMQYHLEADPGAEPTLADMVEVAVRSLARNPRGFFLFVEGGRIDHGHHENRPLLALDETIELDLAVKRATELLAPDDSLVVVTADHAHVMAFNGYPDRGHDVLGVAGLDSAGAPYMTLSYTNGPGARAHTPAGRPDVTADQDYGTLSWRSHADAPLVEETHGGADVAVFGWGRGHWVVNGVYEQSQLPHRMAAAARLGDYAAADASHSLAPATSLAAAVLLALHLAAAR